MRTNTLEIMRWISSQVSKVDRTRCGEALRTFFYSFHVTDALVCKHRLSVHAGEQSVSGRAGAVPWVRHTSAPAAVGHTRRGQQPVLPQHTPGDTRTAGERRRCVRGSRRSRPLREFCSRRRGTGTAGGDGHPSGEEPPPETAGQTRQTPGLSAGSKYWPGDVSRPSFVSSRLIPSVFSPRS